MNIWLQVELTVPASDVEAVTQALEQFAALSISLSDPGGNPILEPGPGATPLWPRVIVTARLPPGPPHDIVVANILADSLIALAPALRQRARDGARVAMSGILTAQAERVCNACAPWLELRLAAELNDWVLLAGTAGA